MVDAVLIILAVGILVALVAMRYKPGSRRPVAAAGAPSPPRPGGARLGALRTGGGRPAGLRQGGAPPGGLRQGGARSGTPRPTAAPPAGARPGGPAAGSPHPRSPHPGSPHPGSPHPASLRSGVAPPGEGIALPAQPAAGAAAPHTALLARPALGALEAVAGPQTGSRFGLMPGDNRLGRAGGNHVRLTDGAVSSQHAIVRVTGGQAVIFDDASTNGTYVNGEQVLEPRRLQDGDQITLGETALVVRLPTAPTSLPSGTA